MDEYLQFELQRISKALERIANALERPESQDDDEDVCGLCGKSGADKMPHPEHWPGEAIPDTELVHAECEQRECLRAHAALSDGEREEHLSTIK